MSHPEPPEQHVRDFVDRALRELLSQPANLRGLLAEVVPDLVAAFDFERMQPARREYFLGNWRSREADLLFEVPFRLPDREDWALVCLLVDHQTRADWRTPLRTLIYAVLYWEWQLRLWEAQAPPRQEFLLRPLLPVVLHTGARPWGTVKGLRDLLVEPEALRQFLPEWRPLFWEVAEHSTEQLLQARDAFLRVLALFKVEDEEAAAAEPVVRQALEGMAPLYAGSVGRWRELLNFVLGWGYHRRPGPERGRWQALVEQAQANEERRREARMQGMTIADVIRNEGKVELLLRLGRKKWGEPDAATLQTLQAIQDGARLDRLAEALLEAQSWAELLNVT